MPLPEIPLEESNFGNILVATKQAVTTLALPGIAADNIVISKLGWIDVTTDAFPRIIIEPRTEIKNADDGTNERDDTVYSVMISLLFAGGLDDGELNMGLALYWRQKVWRTFINKKPDTFSTLTLESGSNLLRVWVEPGDVYIEPAKRQQLDGQYVLGRFLVREPRT